MPAISPNKPYRVGRSRTGLGLFATKPIKKGAKIVRYFGPLLDSKKKKDDAIENKYLFELNGKSAHANGKLLNGHGGRAAPGKMAKSGISVKARGKAGGESRASA